MENYDEVKASLVKIGFKDVSKNYSSRAATLLHVGYGHNKDPHPKYQIRVFRTQEGGFNSGKEIYFQDWLQVTNEPCVRVTSYEQIWAAGMRLSDVALKMKKAA